MADGTYESTSELRSGAELRSFYIDSINAASDEERNWRKKADETWKVYTGERGGAFNILHSNTETIVPAIFNSLPVPDIRTRFGDRDEPARRGAQMLERALSYEMDEYDAQEVAEKAVRDFAITGRGVLRVKYDPLLDTRPQLDELGQPVIGPDGAPQEQEVLVWEAVKCEFTPFDRFRRGPGVHWEQVPWIAFQKFLTRDELVALAGPEIGMDVPLNCSTNGTVEERDGTATREKDVFRCAAVWEIWDKTRRKVVYVSEAYDKGLLAVIPDPLKLAGFFPVPRPLQVLNQPGTLVPIVPYTIYERQAKELDRISDRILKLTEMAKFRGVRAAELAELDSLENLEEGQFMPSGEAMAILNNNGGLDRAIWTMPLNDLVLVIRELVQQREIIKQTIFEQMGIADIMRGASHASETLGAQKLKAQWGSLKIQIWQNEVQRFWRDLFRLKAEIIAEHFQPDTLMAISGESPPPPPSINPQEPPDQQRQKQLRYQQQRQSFEQMMARVFQLLKSDIQRRYRIDIETDSTIQADRTRDQGEWNEFLTASAQFAQIFGPMVQQQMVPAELPIALYQAYSSRFKVGKQVEDLLSRFSEMAGPLAQQQQQSEMQAKQQQNEVREMAKAEKSLDLQKKQQEVVGQQIENRNAAMGIASGPGIVN